MALGHTFILEQPGGSAFRHFPHWRYFCKYIAVDAWIQVYFKLLFLTTFSFNKGNLFEGKVIFGGTWDPSPTTKNNQYSWKFLVHFLGHSFT